MYHKRLLKICEQHLLTKESLHKLQNKQRRTQR